LGKVVVSENGQKAYVNNTGVYQRLSDLEAQMAGAKDSSVIDGINNQIAVNTASLADIVQVNVKSFGAKGDGITDDTTAFVNALTYLNNNGGGKLLVPLTLQKTYKINGNIDINLQNDVEIVSSKGVVIDGTASTSDKLLYLHGSRGSSSPLSSDVTQYAVSLNSNLVVSAGDIILITSTDLWNSTRSYYYKGEMCQVDSVSGTTINLKQPLNDGYTASTTTIFKLNMPKITVKDLTILRNSTNHGLYVQYAKDIEINNCKVTGARNSGFAVEYCYGGQLINNQASDCYDGASGLSYGLEIDSSQFINVIGGRYLDGRHGITTGGQEPCRYINFDGVLCSGKIGSGLPGLDFHGNIEFVNVKNCTCTGDQGIGGNPINAIIENCRVIGYSAGGISFYLEVGKFGYIEIKKCVINSPSYSGVEIRPNVNSLNLNRIVFEDNIVNSSGNGFLIMPVDSTHGSGFVCTEVLNNDNNIISATGTPVVISNQGTNYLSINNTKFDKGYYLANGNGNTVLINVDTNSDVSFDNVRIITAVDGQGLQIGKARNITISRSHVIGKTVSPYSGALILQCSDTLMMVNSKLENFRAYKGIDCSGLQIAGSPVPLTTIFNGNRFVNCTGTIRTASTTQNLSMLTDNGLKIAFATAAPTSLTWAVGDRLYNSTPVVGSPKSWVCTVAGTPGTWVSEGNL
jgi:hypothetical protein